MLKFSKIKSLTVVFDFDCSVKRLTINGVLSKVVILIKSLEFSFSEGLHFFPSHKCRTRDFVFMHHCFLAQSFHLNMTIITSSMIRAFCSGVYRM